jgi:hypothetical protein
VYLPYFSWSAYLMVEKFVPMEVLLALNAAALVLLEVIS